jgi:hypothetical protein
LQSGRDVELSGTENKGSRGRVSGTQLYDRPRLVTLVTSCTLGLRYGAVRFRPRSRLGVKQTGEEWPDSACRFDRFHAATSPRNLALGSTVYSGPLHHF